MIGVINLNKPSGITSSDAVCRVKKILGTKAVGHFGTLDPIGEGVLLMGVGKATRLFDLMLKKDKIYEASFEFGRLTDSLDLTGNTIEESAPLPTFESIKRALPSLIGKQMQVPPIYSAKSVSGKRAYVLARSGAEVTLKPCPIEIFDLKALSYESGILSLNIHCSSGTYVRSIGRDLANLLGTHSTMLSIKRLKCGPYEIADSVDFSDLERLKEDALIPIDTALSDLPKVELDDSFYERLCNGIKPDGKNIVYESFSLYCKGELFGIAKLDDRGRIAIVSYLRN